MNVIESRIFSGQEDWQRIAEMIRALPIAEMIWALILDHVADKLLEKTSNFCQTMTSERNIKTCKRVHKKEDYKSLY